MLTNNRHSGAEDYPLPAFLLLFAFSLLLIAAPVSAQETLQKNGFDLANAIIPPQEILRGGPPRDGIPAINNPQFVPAAAVDFLADDDIVIAVHIGDTARAYPTRILVWHEIVNDHIGDSAFVVTYCPLCGTAMVFDRRINGSAREFGVSGLLYNSDVLMYDKQTDSLWSQLKMQAISGAAVGATLAWLPSDYLTFAAWREQNPHGEVLSTDTGYNRDYTANAYESYFASPSPMFPVPQTRDELASKEWVIGVLINGEAKAYPVITLPDNTVVYDEVGGKAIAVRYHAANQQPTVTDETGAALPAVLVFWFAWQAFYPDTGLWEAAG